MIAHEQGDTDNGYTVVAGYVSVASRDEREAGLHRVQEHNIARRAYRARWSLERIFHDHRTGERGRPALARLAGRVEQFDAVLVHGRERVEGTGLTVACDDHGVDLIDTGRER